MVFSELMFRALAFRRSSMGRWTDLASLNSVPVSYNVLKLYFEWSHYTVPVIVRVWFIAYCHSHYPIVTLR